jgi:hypothetical protein
MMKTLLFATVLLIPATLWAAPPTQAPLQAPGKSVQAPMQAPSQAPVQAPGKMAPGKMATVPQPGGYRTFSYEPGYQPAMAPVGYYNGPYNYGPGYRSGPARSGFHDAGFKVRGDW